MSPLDNPSVPSGSNRRNHYNPLAPDPNSDRKRINAPKGKLIMREGRKVERKERKGIARKGEKKGVGSRSGGSREEGYKRQKWRTGGLQSS